MDLENDELRATKEMSLYDLQLKEDKLIKELKIILCDAPLTSDWKKTIKETIELLGGDLKCLNF